MTDPRLNKIFDEGSKLFINKGFARTHINYIANACGISVGAVYMLFTSKEAILNFILKCVIDREYMNSNVALPINANQFDSLQNEIVDVFKENNENFRVHLQDDSYKFKQMLSDAFDIIFNYGRGFLIFQNNDSDCGELYTYYVNFRKQFCYNIAKYVERYIKNGEIRNVQYIEHHSRLIIETLSWWGMHVRYDAFETNTGISQEVSKHVALDALLHAYSI
jgi:AcrR family transcriptional regulator